MRKLRINPPSDAPPCLPGAEEPNPGNKAADSPRNPKDAFWDEIQDIDPDPPPPPLPDELRGLELSFLAPPKFFVSVSVPEHTYRRLQRYGISKFFEEAVASFDGDLKALVEASLELMKARRDRNPTEAICNANGRVLKSTLQKIESIKDSLAGIRGISRAKVLGGIVRLKLNAMK